MIFVYMHYKNIFPYIMFTYIFASAAASVDISRKEAPVLYHKGIKNRCL